MLFAVVSDAVWLALIVAVSGLIKEYFDRKRAKEAAVKVAEVADKADVVAVRQEEAAAKVEEVAVKLDESNARHVEHDDIAASTNRKLEEIAIVADKTHLLVNSQHGIALSTVYEQALRIALLTGLPEDRLKADVAKVKLDDHQRKQEMVDAKDAKE